MTSTTSDPVYLRIAVDLRRRIDSGALRAGQRVPSTRRLATRWNVAVATASKALALLARDGVTVAIPRVGYVVARSTPREEPNSGRDGSLTRARLVAAAIEAADQEGLEALSMRGVAAKIGAPVTSLYRHVTDKNELLRLMLDSVMAEHAHPAGAAGWRRRLEIGARLEWSLIKRHPWVARVMTLTRPPPSEASLVHADWMLGALEEAGFDATTRMNVHIAIYAFVQGLATNLESEAHAEGETGVDDKAWMRERDAEFRAVAANGSVPAFARVLSSLAKGFDLDLDGVF
ncbi:MAG TPA: TetR/AcrR family transcriptional regulator C-terminal domain-containing protein, partial [Polyangiaceae bacterium]|nr:TetR/AcrR family transcriptional regulator C-terminal domain-containing protein [Polyangiaceae bacterium]